MNPTIQRDNRSLVPLWNKDVRRRSLFVEEMVGATPIHQHKHLRLLLVYELAFPLANEMRSEIALP